MMHSRKSLVSILTLILICPALCSAAVIVDDSWTDGGRDNGADPLDTDWWSTTTSGAIEINTPDGPGVGLVSGTSGRGIRATFPQSTLANVGDSITATYTFNTSSTIRTSSLLGAAWKVGLFDTLGRAGLEADLSASSGTPNPLYEGIPGYMTDFDVDDDDPGADINIRRRRTTGDSGRLLATTSNFTDLSGSGTDGEFAFAASTEYVGEISIVRTGADSLDITGSLSQGGSLLSTYTQSDSGTDVHFTYGMLAFHANSNAFGSTNSNGVADNGVTFSNVTIDVSIVPEPSSAGLMVLAGLLLGWFRKLR